MNGANGRTTWNLVRKSLKNSGGSHDFENHFFIDSNAEALCSKGVAISTAKPGSCAFLIIFRVHQKRL